MTSHSRHSVTAVTLPYLFRPAEIAEALGCSEWWVKEQARKRRIPFTRLGGAYRFTAEHVDEIVRVFEERPSRGTESPPEAAQGARSQRRPQTVPTGLRLRAKRPRRAVAFAAV
ncbi:helix-turn-helix domain-containing protein [Streptomyces sp. SCSIO 30461]|uniref:helix-turn-helix domain-containing protein n=1 Tax=Streptomyces sp. SCSIO 30461 TaxID=3118085 RepID=UPI0030D18655